MARGAGYAALLGAVLIGVAVIIGIVLLQIGDKNDNGPAAGTNKPKTTTTTRPKTSTTTPLRLHAVDLRRCAPRASCTSSS